MRNFEDCLSHRVLLIENDAPVRELISDHLMGSGYVVLETNHLPDPSDVIQLWPDLIILGNVPGGEETVLDYVCELKAWTCTVRLLVLVSSGVTNQSVEGVMRADRTIVSRVLFMPSKLQHLLDTVESIIFGTHTSTSPTAQQDQMGPGADPWGRVQSMTRISIHD